MNVRARHIIISSLVTTVLQVPSVECARAGPSQFTARAHCLQSLITWFSLGLFLCKAQETVFLVRYQARTWVGYFERKVDGTKERETGMRHENAWKLGQEHRNHKSGLNVDRSVNRKKKPK